MKQEYEVVYLQTCEVGFRDVDVIKTCGKPAIAIMIFNGEESTYVCSEHLEEIENDLKESEDE